MADSYVLTEHAFLELRRQVHAQQREIVNLKNRLASYGTRRHENTWKPGAQLYRARMTEDLDDDNPLATANDWNWNAGDEEYYDTENEVELQCFLRPEGETIADRTRVLYTIIGGIKEIVVVNCEPDPEEE